MNMLKAATFIGTAAVASTLAFASGASAATPVPGAAVYTSYVAQPTATVPVYYKCTRRGCGYFFYRKYGTPVVYTPAPQPGLGGILGPLLAIPGTVVTGTTGVVGGVVGGVGQTTGAVLPALSLGLL